MRRRAVLSALGCFLQLACVSETSRKIKIEIPHYSPVVVGAYKELVVTNFREKEEIKDFNLNKELVDYLVFELARRLKAQVTVQTVVWDKENLIEDKEFWKSLRPATSAALFLTGDVLYTQEIRKSLPEKETKTIDGPFKPVSQGLSERLVSNLTINFCLIQAGTGDIVYRKEFKENLTFTNTNQPFSFAFYELLPRLKQRFFRMVMAEDARQERYLITQR